MRKRPRWDSLLMVGLQEVADGKYRIVDLLCVGKKHKAEMIRRGPVESAAGHDEDVLGGKQIEGKLLVVGDLDIGTDLREYVEGSMGLVIRHDTVLLQNLLLR